MALEHLKLRALTDRYPAAQTLPVLDTAELIEHHPQDWYRGDYRTTTREIMTEWKDFCEQAREGRAIVLRTVLEGVLRPNLEAIHSFLLAHEVLSNMSPFKRDRVLEGARRCFSVAAGLEQGSIDERDLADTRLFVGLFEKAVSGTSSLL